MKNIRLYDMYDFWGIHLGADNRIGSYETMEEAKRAAARYDWDCGGECDIYVCLRNPETGTFLAIDAMRMVYDDLEVWA